MLRFVATGNPVGAPVGEILEIIGKDITFKRLKNGIEYFKD